MTERVGRLACTSIDCEDPGELADFYAALLGLERVIEADGGDVIVVSDGRIALAMMKADDFTAPTWPDRPSRSRCTSTWRSTMWSRRLLPPRRLERVRQGTKTTQLSGG